MTPLKESVLQTNDKDRAILADKVSRRIALEFVMVFLRKDAFWLVGADIHLSISLQVSETNNACLSLSSSGKILSFSFSSVKEFCSQG